MLYLLFVKYGCLSFGGGYVLITLFIHDLVEKYQLLTDSQFGNLLAISQMTPGPIGINAATYIGYLTNGITGGIIASIGLITPAVFLVIAAAFYFRKWEKHPVVQGILYGMRPATLGLIISAILVFANIAIFKTPITAENVNAWLSPMASHDIGSFGIRLVPLLIAVTSALLLARFKKINIIYLIAGAAIIGALFIR